MRLANQVKIKQVSVPAIVDFAIPSSNNLLAYVPKSHFMPATKKCRKVSVNGFVIVRKVSVNHDCRVAFTGLSRHPNKANASHAHANP